MPAHRVAPAGPVAGPAPLFATIAITTGLAVAILNPFVSTQGDLILIDGPTSVFLDLQVTLEELLYGLAAGARLAAVTLLTGAFLALVDRDRLAARAALVAPRSALTVALAARLLPALRRDASTLHEAARLRGWRTGAGAARRCAPGAACSSRCAPRRSSAAATTPRRWPRAATAPAARRRCPSAA